MSDYPVLDAPRPFGNTELFRTILDYFGELEPHVEEVDSCVALPLRLIHDVVAGMQLEIGPYTLDRRDIERLRAAITAYGQAVGA